MFRAERHIAKIRAEYLERTVAAWSGYERLFLIELVRGLDEVAFAFTMAPNRAELIREDIARHYMAFGSASAIRPFLEAVRDDPGGVPWGPTSNSLSSVADQYLRNCGELLGLQRLAALERYGLAEARYLSDEHLVLEVESDDDDFAEVRSGAWLGEQARQQLAESEARMAAMKSEVAAKIDFYTDVHDGWFIRYDPNWEMIEYHRDCATTFAAGTAEADALPGDAMLGGRFFAEWNETSITALGRVLHHIACSTRLKATKPSLELRNLLTVFARKDDILAMWQEVGEKREEAERIFDALTLDMVGAAAAERDFDVPLPYYIDFGRHFVLLPTFGGLMNPHAGLVWHLRRSYRSDWDRSVDRREQVFRHDLRQLFPGPRFFVPVHGIRLKRADGSHLTDVDAVVLDSQTGALNLVQLKWPDIYGRSLAQRNSRRINLLKANEWVGRVYDWIADRSAADVARVLGLGEAGGQRPDILVIARHTARFSGEVGYDQRARWISWPRLAQLRARFPERDMRSLLAGEGQRTKNSPARARKGVTSSHRLPGLKVDVSVT